MIKKLLLTFYPFLYYNSFMKLFWKIFWVFLAWRLILLLPLIFGPHFVAMQPNSVMYTMWAYTRPYFPVGSFLLYPWANFDGVHYLTIVGSGYLYGADGRFFPLYPFVSAAVSYFGGRGAFMGLQQFFSAFLLANGAFVASLYFLYKLIRLDYDKKIAWWTIVLLLVFPTSFFFGATYSESFFLLLSILVFYFIRTKKMWYASIAAMLLLTTRVTGICIIPIMLYYIFQDEITLVLKRKKFVVKNLWRKLGMTAILPIGIGIFALYSLLAWKDALFFIHAQMHVVPGRSSSIVLFLQTIVRYLRILVTVPHTQFVWWISLLEFASFFFAATLLVVSYFKKINMSYLVYSLLSFLFITASGTFAGLGRYVMILFPLFITFALVKNKYVKIVYIIISFVALLILTLYFAQGYLVA